MTGVPLNERDGASKSVDNGGSEGDLVDFDHNNSSSGIHDNDDAVVGNNNNSHSGLPRGIFWASVVVLSLAIILPLEILDVIYRDTGPWIRWFGANEQIGDGADWCEAIDADLSQFIIEPWNSRSDYAFTTWGCFLIVLGISDGCRLWWKRNGSKSNNPAPPNGQPYPEEEAAMEAAVAAAEVLPPRASHRLNPILRFPHLTVVNGIYNIVHGLGSFWYHACECKLGGRADVSGMLAVVVFASAYTPLQLLARANADPASSTLSSTRIDALLSVLPPLCQTLLFVLVWHGTIPGTLTFTILVYVTVAVIPLSMVYLYCWRNKKTYPVGQEQQQQQHILRWWLYPLGLFCFGMAFWAWNLDLSGVWCFDEGILRVLQGHAVWHVLSAVALGCNYYLYRSEEITITTATTATAGNTMDAVLPNDEPVVEIVESGQNPVAE